MILQHQWFALVAYRDASHTHTLANSSGGCRPHTDAGEPKDCGGTTGGHGGTTQKTPTRDRMVRFFHDFNETKDFLLLFTRMPVFVRRARQPGKHWFRLMPLLEIQDLTLAFDRHNRPVVDRVSLTLAQGQILGLVGESGSGKSITALSIARLLPSPPARYLHGQIRLDGRDVLAASRRSLRELRGGVVSYIFQEPGRSLNPVLRIDTQIRETLRQHRKPAGRVDAIRLLERVGIPSPELRSRDYPHQLSGGMQQRLMIAMALASQPKLLVADEPTTALDVTIQAQILELLADLRHQLGMSILLITHNLGLISQWADRVAVMYAGQIVESGPVPDVLRTPRHPYTRMLLHSVPRLGAGTARLTAIPGAVPNLPQVPAGCRFHPRCPHAQPDCRQIEPVELPVVSEDHTVRCPYALALP
jgi:oligopeptide/dipeptide ABC transporter ATP-binding protein